MNENYVELLKAKGVAVTRGDQGGHGHNRKDVRVSLSNDKNSGTRLVFTFYDCAGLVSEQKRVIYPLFVKNRIYFVPSDKDGYFLTTTANKGNPDEWKRISKFAIANNEEYKKFTDVEDFDLHYDEGAEIYYITTQDTKQWYQDI